jgi:hypothetical protein
MRPSAGIAIRLNSARIEGNAESFQARIHALEEALDMIRELEGRLDHAIGMRD